MKTQERKRIEEEYAAWKQSNQQWESFVHRTEMLRLWTLVLVVVVITTITLGEIFL